MDEGNILDLTLSDEDGDIDMAPLNGRYIFRLRKTFDEEDFRERFRFDREGAEQLLRQIGRRIAPQKIGPNTLSTKERLLLALRFYAGGTSTTTSTAPTACGRRRGRRSC